MKVIHLISGGDTGGAKTHIHYLLSGICKNIEATLVCFMRGEFSEEAERLGIPTVVLDGSLPSAIRRLRAMIKDGGYDIIHSHGSRGNFIASILRLSCKIPVVSTVHSDPRLDYLGRPAAALVYGTLNDYALHRADYLIGVSDSMKDLLIERSFPPNEIFTIYNGVDFSVEPKTEDRLEYLRGLGLDVSEDSVVVGIAARLDPVKDIATLIKGFAAAEASCPRLRLVIAGDGAELENLKALAKELGIFEKTAFPGWISEINSFFASIDINTLSSVSETFPYAITEGARARLATVSSRVGGVPKLILDGETGFLFCPGDHAVLGRKLLELAEDAALRRKLGNALFEKAKREFSVEATTRRQLDIYSEVLKREAVKKNGGRNGVVICGAYGMGNAGDDAILEAIVGEMREIDPFMPITALSRRPVETRLKYSIDCLHMFDIPAFIRTVRGTKLYISGGGSLIQNVTSRRSLWYYLYTISAAKKMGNAVMMYGCGIGPIADNRDENLIRRVLSNDVDVITLREKYSLSELERLSVTGPELVVSSDPALTLKASSEDRVSEELQKYGLDTDGKYICFSVRNWPGFEEKAQAFAEAADRMAEELELTPVFLLINRIEDGAASQLICGLMKTKAAVIGGTMDSSLTIGVLSHMRAVVSMRLHGLIFASSQGVPIVGVSYDPKVTAFLDSVGSENCIMFEELTAEKLINMTERAITQYDDRDARRSIVERLISAEARNSQYVRKLLGEER
ncbi:MAG: polysaccharide pyruvyl transferase CsaB [Oscillospiraceae bacterium]|nr:polysaccharide pyruvyl transferase CsaB [Oscillospiraceae bacterium]